MSLLDPHSADICSTVWKATLWQQIKPFPLCTVLASSFCTQAIRNIIHSGWGTYWVDLIAMHCGARGEICVSATHSNVLRHCGLALC